ncbi:MAG: hypothetical protein CBB97_09065 [Candidatus Endolissoclinum sp. TMED37]|nr:MAG: hypothetical protein CBB97_09065 [Candidatus Endolissoclinum sp. TMED37]|tara:strand:+ start:376 stop:1131 length:756 start_codon:yes stop_codon:yes gene_type:complete
MKKKDLINLKSKICVVTGCNGYIGKSVAAKLSSLGAKIIGTDIKYKKNRNLNTFIKINLEKKSEINFLIEEINKKFKKVDILINNASYVGTSETKANNQKKTFYNEKFENVNLSNTIYLTNSLIHLLEKSRSPSIINISSIYSFLGYDYDLYKNTQMKRPLAYGVSKAGIVQYTKMLSNIVAPKIRVNAISPGGIVRNQPKKFIKRYLSKTPLKRMGREEDIVNAIIYLSSDLSSYVTGQNLIVDGGYSNA